MQFDFFGVFFVVVCVCVVVYMAFRHVIVTNITIEAFQSVDVVCLLVINQFCCSFYPHSYFPKCNVFDGVYASAACK